MCVCFFVTIVQPCHHQWYSTHFVKLFVRSFFVSSNIESSEHEPLLAPATAGRLAVGLCGSSAVFAGGVRTNSDGNKTLICRYSNSANNTQYLYICICTDIYTDIYTYIYVYIYVYIYDNIVDQ